MGEGRQGMALRQAFTGRKNTIQHLRSPDLIMISWSPLTLRPTAASTKSQLVWICPPFLGLTPPSLLLSPTQPN